MQPSTRWRVTAAASAALLVVVGVFSWLSPSAGHSSKTLPTSRTSPFPPSLQNIYTAALQHDKASLDRGVLTYTPINRLKTATSSVFKVMVTDVGRGPQVVAVHTASGMTVYQQDVPTGAAVGVEIVNCGNLTCEAESSSRQLVLAEGESADWSWFITPGQPGPATITVRADTYDQGTQQVLSEELFNISGTVLPTPAFKHRQGQHAISAATHTGITVTETIGTLVGSIGAIVAAAGGIFAWRRRRKRTARQPLHEHDQSDAKVEQPSAQHGPHGVDGQEEA